MSKFMEVGLELAGEATTPLGVPVGGCCTRTEDELIFLRPIVAALCRTVEARNSVARGTVIRDEGGRAFI